MADKDNLDVKSPIVMKVDGPPDENISSNSSSDEKSVLYEKKIFNEIVPPRNSFIPKPVTSKVPVLAKPKFGGGNPFAVKPSILSSPKLNFGNNSSKAILRPSKLSQQTNLSSAESNTTKKPFVLNPQSNPFLKVDKSDDNEIDTETKEDEKKHVADDGDKNSSTSLNPPQPVSEPPKFVPLSGASNSSSSTTNSTSSNANSSNSFSSTSFVFGQNLRERIVGEPIEGNGIDSALLATPSSSCSTNGTSDTLFSSAAAVNACDNKSNDIPPSEAKSLSEAAREYEESRAQKRKYEEVTVITGEENEENIMQISCKLFAFDQATRNWQERGRGNLRLNDIRVETDDEATSSSNCYTQSRVVVRAAGSLRVVLNTKIWAGMSVEMASTKSIRLTAMDSSGIVKVFLVMANIKEIEKLYKLLKNRVDAEITRQNIEENESVAKRKATESD